MSSATHRRPFRLRREWPAPGICSAELDSTLIVVVNDNDIQSLIQVFKSVKDSKRPIVVHIHTQKGKGYRIADENREAWHWCLPFDRATGKPTANLGCGESYEALTADYLVEKAKSDPEELLRSLGITPQAIARDVADLLA